MITVDTSIIINAYSNPKEDNPYWDFLEDFKRHNQKRPKIHICIDLASKIKREYEQAIVQVYGEGALDDFAKWFEATGILKAISSEDGFIPELGNHRDSLEQDCEGKGLVFIARAFHNRKIQGRGIIVADKCDIVTYRKPFFDTKIRQYLWNKMKIKVVTIDNVQKEIQDIWSTPRLSVILRDKMIKAFNIEELEDLRFSMELDWFPSNTLSRQSRVRDLIEHCKRRNLLFELSEYCRNERDKIEWPEFEYQT